MTKYGGRLRALIRRTPRSVSSAVGNPQLIRHYPQSERALFGITHGECLFAVYSEKPRFLRELNTRCHVYTSDALLPWLLATSASEEIILPFHREQGYLRVSLWCSFRVVRRRLINYKKSQGG